MQEPDLVSLFVVPLNRLGLRYMVTGAVAAVIYGEPRLTRDLDLVLELPSSDVSRVVAAFPSAAFYVPPVEVIEEEIRRPRLGHFNLIHQETAQKADLYLVGDDPLHAWAMERRTRQDVDGDDVWVAPIEYVILRKLEWYRDGRSSKHLDDIRAMLRVSGDQVDDGALEAWIEQLDLAKEWSLAASEA